jgi:hypothetical protein
MVERTKFETVSDGDYLSEGYFNNIGTFYVSASDSSSSDLVTVSNSNWQELATFTFSGFDTDTVITEVFLKDIKFWQFKNGGNDTARLSVKLTDGSTYYTWDGRSSWDVDVGLFTQEPLFGRQIASTDYAPFRNVFVESEPTYSSDYYFKVPPNLMTGNTDYSIQIHALATQASTNYALLGEGFTVGLGYTKLIRSESITTSQI